MQCTERAASTQRNHTLLAVFLLSMNPSARLLLSPPQVFTPASAQDLCSGFRAHPTVPTRTPSVQERGGLMSGTGASCCWSTEDSG